MRRTDLSRKMGKAVSIIQEMISLNQEVSLVSVRDAMETELGLNGSKVQTVSGIKIVNYKDDEFECSLKRPDIYKVDDNAKDNGVKDIEVNYGMVQVKYTPSRLIVNLVTEATYTTNDDKKVTVYPILKNFDIELSSPEATVAPEKVSKTKEDELVTEEVAVDDTTDTEQDVIKTYKDYMSEAIVNIFGERFYGTVPSDKFIDIIVNKIHNIYVVNYLEQLFTDDNINDSSSLGIKILSDLIDTL